MPLPLAALALLLIVAAPLTAAHAEEAADAAIWAETREPMPFDIIRSLQFLQDQVARGNDRAIRVQALLLRRFGPVFLRSDAAVWQDRRNRRAAVLFALSGGPPEVLAGLIAAGAPAADEEALFRGALSYVRNDLEPAREAFALVDLDALEPGLAAHLHLVLGQIYQAESPDEAVHHLDRARLLAPGGLIEEAALRLETMLVAQRGEHERADRLARQYFGRYARSAYAENFEARFSAIQSARAGEEPAETLQRMAVVLSGLPPERQRRLYLSVARRSLVEGKLAFARLAAERALLAGEPSVDERERARLYAVAASVATRPTPEALAELAGLDGTLLVPADRGLLDAARSVVGVIEREPIFVGPATVDAEPSATVARAERILDETRLNEESTRP